MKDLPIPDCPMCAERNGQHTETCTLRGADEVLTLQRQVILTEIELEANRARERELLAYRGWASLVLLRYMMANDVDGFRMAGRSVTVTPEHRRVRLKRAGKKLSDEEKRAAVDAFQSLELHELVNINHNSLGSWAKQFTEQADLPAELQEVVEIAAVPTLNVRKV